ncbi:hypothetical protein PHMEG_00019965 [Phytophthora megakarya]|uniref:ZSWIM1/3 RNaseH-like domain-containing protein n=1 Tax=Phytophthora megakarya TaxID=4795 RepID=A0A225VQA9_9STRA|nr:hypothetical protein PHMEG_00019965 [Phytophthora megakarya]
MRASRLKSKSRGQNTAEGRLSAVLRKFCSYRGNQASIFVDDKKTTQTITLHTRKMKRFFETLPEVKGLTTMNDWHDITPKFDAFGDLAAWIRVSGFTRIVLPPPAQQLRHIDTRFGQIGIEEMSYFRRFEWLDDSCMKLIISHIMDQDQDGQGRSRIGGFNPLYARVFDKVM